MSRGQEQRLAKLEQLATPATRGSGIRRYLRDASGVPDHARAAVDRWRRFAAASEADAGGTFDDTVDRLLTQGFTLDASMLAAIERRLAEIEAASMNSHRSDWRRREGDRFSPAPPQAPAGW